MIEAQGRNQIEKTFVTFSIFLNFTNICLTSRPI